MCSSVESWTSRAKSVQLGQFVTAPGWVCLTTLRLCLGASTRKAFDCPGKPARAARMMKESLTCMLINLPEPNLLQLGNMKPYIEFNYRGPRKWWVLVKAKVENLQLRKSLKDRPRSRRPARDALGYIC